MSLTLEMTVTLQMQDEVEQAWVNACYTVGDDVALHLRVDTSNDPEDDARAAITLSGREHLTMLRALIDTALEVDTRFNTNLTVSE